MTEAKTYAHGFSKACPECGWPPATKDSRSQVRRSLARHFINEHAFERENAWTLAYNIVPRHPDERPGAVQPS